MSKDSGSKSKIKFKPYVPADSQLPELTIKALVLGVLMAIVLGAANAYLGMKAGLTVAATFPAAVVAMAALRPFKGSILEENIARTTASVGEALVAGAIFTIPAFVISGVWEDLHYRDSTLIMLIGGLLGVLFVIVLRRTLVEEAELPFPESVAAAELVKAGQGGQSGASYVFIAMGLAGLWELFKNANGVHLVADYARTFGAYGASQITILGQSIRYRGGVMFESAAASPALVGVGFIVGPKISSVLFAGALTGWLFLVPLSLFLNPSLTELAGDNSMIDLSVDVWRQQVRPLAVGTMIVAAFYTLYQLRTSLIAGIGKAVSDLQETKGEDGNGSRLDRDLDFKKVGVAIAVLSLPVFLLYWYFSGSLAGSLLLTVVMVVLGFLFAAVAGYLVGLIGSSNNPISGLTLSTLLISAVLMVMIGVTGDPGIMAVLGVAGVICCTAGIAGDMMQDLKVGHILGGTPWKMEVGEIIGVIVAALVLIWPMIAMHSVYTIGSEQLPAPQAGLMAMLAKGIVGGEMAWPLVIAGMFFAFALILIGAPSPMLIAVGMYLPFHSTAAIFVGGIIRWLLNKILEKRKADEGGKTSAVNAGILLSSGFIAGEALMAVLLAFLVLGTQLTESMPPDQLAWLPRANPLPILTSYLPGFLQQNPWLGLVGFIGLFTLLIGVPLKAMRRGGALGVSVE